MVMRLIYGHHNRSFGSKKVSGQKNMTMVKLILTSKVAHIPLTRGEILEEQAARHGVPATRITSVISGSNQ